MDPQALTTVVTGALLAMFAAILAWNGKGRMDGMDRRFDRLEAEVVDLRREISELRRETNELRRDFNAEIGSLRRDFNQLVLAIAPQLRPQTG